MDEDTASGGPKRLRRNASSNADLELAITQTDQKYDRGGLATVNDHPNDDLSVKTGSRVLIAAGGTAGHVVPALAVADTLRSGGNDVVFVGGARAEAELVPAAGYRFRQLSLEGISRSNPLKAVRAIGKALLAVGKAYRLLRKERLDVVVGGGGYVAGPVGFAALVCRIPLILTEADSHLGLTNRLLAPFAHRICLAFSISGRDGQRYRVTGRPVAESKSDRRGARAKFGISDREQCVLVFGGSLGARSLNHTATKAFADASYRVLHITGEREFATTKAPSDRYILRDYVTPFSDALLAADLVVARAGGSIFEIAQYGKPSILVPYPHATADHQTTNARRLEQAGAAIAMPEDQLSPELLRQRVDELLGDRQQIREMREAALRWARPSAARAVAREVLRAASSSTPTNVRGSER